MEFSLCAAAEHTPAFSRSSQSDDGYAAIGSNNEDLVCPLCELCDDDLRDDAEGRSVGSRELVVCEGCQSGFHVACVRALPSLRRLPLPAGHPAAVDWTEAHMQRGSGTWQCGACVKEGRWGVSHLIESAVTFSDARCAEGSATYSVLVRFHADGAALEPRYLHGRTSPGCDGSSEIEEPALYQDLCDRQLRRLRKGQDPHGKLERLLQYPLLTGPAWFRPDMSSEQHALTFQVFLRRPPQSTRDWAHAQRLTSPTSSVYQDALRHDRQS